MKMTTSQSLAKGAVLRWFRDRQENNAFYFSVMGGTSVPLCGTAERLSVALEKSDT